MGSKITESANSEFYKFRYFSHFSFSVLSMLTNPEIRNVECLPNRKLSKYRGSIFIVSDESRNSKHLCLMFLRFDKYRRYRFWEWRHEQETTLNTKLAWRKLQFIRINTILSKALVFQDRRSSHLCYTSQVNSQSRTRVKLKNFSFPRWFLGPYRSALFSKFVFVLEIKIKPASTEEITWH